MTADIRTTRIRRLKALLVSRVLRTVLFSLADA
jgi:hypothetical protein